MLSISGRSVLRHARIQSNTRTYLTPVQSLSALARQLSSLAILEQREGKLNHGSLSAVTAARKLGGSITGFVAGSNIKAVAEEVAKFAGIDKVVVIENEAYEKVRLLLYFYAKSHFHTH
jgi:electron transfer flavoprotein alpha subunit